MSNLGQFCYVSSWTEDEEESIPMWKMYASLEAGVRIKLRKNPFEYYDCVLDKKLERTIKIRDGLERTLLPISVMQEHGFLSINAVDDHILHEVEYTEDINKLYPHFLKEQDGQVLIALGELGKYKNLHWQFQREWRYILLMLPFNWNKDPSESYMEMIMGIESGEKAKMFPYYEMRIDDNAYANMEITMSPKLSVGNQILVETVLEKYNPNIALLDSCLKRLL